MTGQTYIDALDLFDTFGITVLKGYNSLVSYPALKPVVVNNWPEEDGEEADLTNPVLDTKTVSITFAAMNGGQPGNFIEMLTDGAYHTLNFTEIGRAFSLRLISQSDIQVDTESKIFIFTLTFSDDRPMEGYSYLEPETTMGKQSRYSIDGKNLGDYGVLVLQGSTEEILKSPAVKTNQMRSFKNNPGLLDDSGNSTYDHQAVYFQAKEATILCLMKAATHSEFWRNYHALLFDLTRPGERRLTSPSIGLDAPFYYKKSQVNRILTEGDVWCQFTLTLQITKYRIPNENILK